MKTQPDDELEYVGFWLRLCALVIDMALLMLAEFLMMFVIAALGFSGVDMGPVLAVIVFSFLYLLILSLPTVVVIVFWKVKQATPGKMYISAKIVDAKTGGPASTGKLILRYIGYFLSALPLCLGFIWIAFDKRKQGWHDKLAGTVVVRERKR